MLESLAQNISPYLQNTPTTNEWIWQGCKIEDLCTKHEQVDTDIKNTMLISFAKKEETEKWVEI